jgi:lipoprotein-anchoring transpeptidase ErfK/SrfK
MFIVHSVSPSHPFAMFLRHLATLLVPLLLVACADTSHRILVSVPEQRLAVYRDGKHLATFPISTSRFGYGDAPGTNWTPLGHLTVAEKIGAGQPSGMKFKSRVPTGEIVSPNSPGRDPIVTRILWLKGEEERNRHAHDRYIYIHGTPEEARLGSPASYGCVRMASDHIIWLYDTVGKGCRVDIAIQALPRSVDEH